MNWISIYANSGHKCSFQFWCLLLINWFWIGSALTSYRLHMIRLVTRFHGIWKVQVLDISRFESAYVCKIIASSFDTPTTYAIEFVPNQRGEIIALVRSTAFEGVEAIYLVNLLVPVVDNLQGRYFVEFAELQEFLCWTPGRHESFWVWFDQIPSVEGWLGIILRSQCNMVVPLDRICFVDFSFRVECVNPFWIIYVTIIKWENY